MLQKKMALNSDVPLLDVKLLTKKSEQRQKRKQKMLTYFHLNLVTTVTYCFEQLPVDCSPTEDELVSAFDGLRVHTLTSEPYFWEHCYNIYPATQPIAVDSGGKAHIFKPVSVQTKSSSEAISTNKERTNAATDAVSRWECDSQLCQLPPDAIQAVTHLFRKLSLKNFSNCRQFYKHLDDCTNPVRDTRLGHSVYCCEENGCRSLLKPAQILSPHFPYLRSVVSRLYEARRLVAAMQSVTAAMQWTVVITADWNSRWKTLTTSWLNCLLAATAVPLQIKTAVKHITRWTKTV